jgi:hypothetical protein
VRGSGDEQCEISIQASGLKLGMCGAGPLKSAVCGLRVKPPLGKERGAVGTSVLHTADLESKYEIYI